MFYSLLTVWHIHMTDILDPIMLLIYAVGNEALLSCSKAC